MVPRKSVNELGQQRVSSVIHHPTSFFIQLAVMITIRCISEIHPCHHILIRRMSAKTNQGPESSEGILQALRKLKHPNSTQKKIFGRGYLLNVDPHVKTLMKGCLGIPKDVTKHETTVVYVSSLRLFERLDRLLLLPFISTALQSFFANFSRLAH
jgi:hypothetical protein